MSQYTAGKISISGADGITVTGYDTKFLYNVRKGDILIIDIDDIIPHFVMAVNSNTSLALAAPYRGKHIDTLLDYSVTRSFVTGFQFPMINTGYKSFATLVTLYLRMIDTIFKHSEMVDPNDPVCGGEGGYE